MSPDIPWLAWAQNAQSVGDAYYDDVDMQFDPTGSNLLYMSAGIGVWHTNPPSTVKAFQWISQSLGIEQLVANEIISPPGGKPLVGSWDRGVFYISNPDAFPSAYGPSNDTAIRHGWSLDWASSNPSFIVGIFNLGTAAGESGYSSDGGLTWTKFQTAPGGSDCCGGSIAAASSTNIVWIPSNNGFLYFTKDGGISWTLGTLPGAPTSGESGWSWAYYLKRQIIAADRVNIGTFYAYNYLKGLYRSTDGGTTWTLVESGQITPFSGYNAKLRTVPGRAGNLFFTGGEQDPSSLSSPAQEQFMRSTDGGVTWTAVPNVLEVFDFGFGAPQTTGGYPTIYIVGFVNNQYGVWRSTDNAQTWTQVGLWPLNSLDQIVAVSGDMNQYGRVYIGFSGSGYAYGDTSGAAASPSPTPAPTPTPTPPSDTTPPTVSITAPTGTLAAGTTQTTLSVTTNENAICAWSNTAGVAFASMTTFTTTGGTSHSTTLSNLTNGSNYTTYVKCKDTAGNISTDSSTAYSVAQQTGGVAGTVTFTPTDSPPFQFLSFNGGPVTCSNVNIGTPSSDRVVVVGVENNAGNNDGGTSAVTINGISATKAVSSDPGKDYASIWYAPITTGTTGNVVVSVGTGASIENMGILVGTITGASSAAPSATGAHATVYDAADPQLIPTSGTVTVPAGGVAVLFGHGGPSDSSDQRWINWTNTTNPNGDFFVATTTWNTASAVLAHSIATGVQSYSISCTAPGCTFAYGGFGGVVAVWGP